MTGATSVASLMRVWIVSAPARATSTSCSAVRSVACASASAACSVSTFVVRTSSSRCDPAPCLTRFVERSSSTWARWMLLFAVVIEAWATATFSRAESMPAMASFSSASSVSVSSCTSTWPGFTSAPSSTRISLTRSGSLAETSTSFASIRPFPEAIPSGSAAWRDFQNGSRGPRSRSRRAPPRPI